MKQFLSKKSVADFFDTSTSTVGRLVDAGVLPPPHKIGGLERWDVDSLMRSAIGSMSEKANMRQASNDADQAIEDYVNATRKNRQAQARGRHA